jgi:hypothetical protein
VSGYQPPRLLQPTDDLDGFTCRSSEQTTWLRRHARQSAATGTTRVFVVTRHASHDVVAYCAWCMAQIDIQSALSRLHKGAGRPADDETHAPLLWRFETRQTRTLIPVPLQAAAVDGDQQAGHFRPPPLPGPTNMSISHTNKIN